MMDSDLCGPERASQVVLVVKYPLANAGDTRDAGLIPGLGRPPRKGNNYPLQYSGLENSTNCIVHGNQKELDTAEQLSVFF